MSLPVRITDADPLEPLLLRIAVALETIAEAFTVTADLPDGIGAQLTAAAAQLDTSTNVLDAAVDANSST